MRTSAVLIVALVALSSVLLIDAIQKPMTTYNPTTKGDNSWDFLLYVARWAGTESHGKTLPNYVDSWTLHGIWPQRTDGTWPSFCNSSNPFDKNQIQDLYQDLEIAWYDYQGNGYQFWSHEWDKHGTCAASVATLNTQHKYFQTAIQVHLKMAIRNTLQQAGISPSTSTSYRMADILNALTTSFGQTPIVSCSDVRGLGDAIDVVTFCLDKSLNLMACPESQKRSGRDSCPSSVYFPPIKH